jgi:hypothetical protein
MIEYNLYLYYLLVIITGTIICCTFAGIKIYSEIIDIIHEIDKNDFSTLENHIHDNLSSFQLNIILNYCLLNNKNNMIMYLLNNDNIYNIIMNKTNYSTRIKLFNKLFNK